MLDVAVREEGHCEDDETSHHHVVEGLEVFYLEHDRKQGLSEPESFLGTFFLLVGGWDSLAFGGAGFLEEFVAELVEGGLDLLIELSLGLQNLDVFIVHLLELRY